MGTVIAALWKVNQVQHKATERRLDECEEDRDRGWGVVHRLAMGLLQHDPEAIQLAAEEATVRVRQTETRKE